MKKCQKFISDSIRSLIVFCVFTTAIFSIHFLFISQGSKNVHPTFEPHYQEFLREAQDHGYSRLKNINITIRFATETETQNSVNTIENAISLAQCRVVIGQDPVITVNKAQWLQRTFYQHQMIIFHELAHCFLLKGHSDRETKEGHHLSLMSTAIFSEQEYLQNKRALMREMFSYKPYHVVDYFDTFLFGKLFN